VYVVPDAAPVGGVNDIFAVVVDIAVAEPIVGADNSAPVIDIYIYILLNYNSKLQF
jgi:hypothetical protein